VVAHDRLFKQLIRTFFVEFIDLFFQQMSEGLDPESIEFLDKQVFTDITAGEQHEADLVVKARFYGQESHFLFHVEPQSYDQKLFPRRMFNYFSRLHEMYGMPVYPIAVLSYDSPLAEAPSEYRVDFPDGEVLVFRYRVVQLNRLNWRDFANRPNPVAAALMAKMRIEPKDRKRVKLQCLRLMLTLKLDQAKMGLIAGFVNTYLRLSEQQEREVRQEIEAEEPKSKEVAMIWTSWHEAGMQEGLQAGMQKGRQEGRQEGLQEGRQEGLQEGRQEEALAFVQRLLRRRLGASVERLFDRVENLSTQRLEELGEALMDFSGVSDLERWLDRAAPLT
jgi:predicted transposase YdaD